MITIKSITRAVDLVQKIPIAETIHIHVIEKKWVMRLVFVLVQILIVMYHLDKQ